jgi:ferredoxin-NADP reductase
MRLTALTLETVTESPTDAVEFVFLPKRPLPFRPGQAGLVIVPDGGVKPFTFACDNRADRISIATTLRSGSRFKRALAGQRPDDRLHVVGAIGTLPSLDPAESQVFVAQGIGITPFLAIARSHDSVNATLLQVGTPHFFGEVAAATRSGAEHHDHREELQEGVSRTIADRPTARWFLSGRPAFVAAVATQLAGAGVPARRIHKAKFWGMRSTAPATTSSTPDRAASTQQRSKRT